MRSRPRTVLALAAVACLSACDVEVYHQLEHYGNSDSGGYQFAMPDETYALFLLSGEYDDFMAQAREFSNPTVRSSGGRTFIEDLSGRASMEHIYDDFACDDDPNSSRYAICEFSADATDLDQSGWTVTWTVALRPDMRMLSSNHHRTRTENGRVLYLWHFDGNRVSSFDVHYRVRTPRA